MSSQLDRTFAAVVFDWDGTAVPDRRAGAAPLRRLVHQLTEIGVELVVVSGTHVGNLDGQLAARPSGPGGLHFCTNRGSEVFRVDASGPVLLERRVATPEEDRALDRAAELALTELQQHGLAAEVVASRLNRRKIDLLPEPAWSDPPKAEIARLVDHVQRRLERHGLDGLTAAVELAQRAASHAGLRQARVTTDAKHVEIGLTDKSDSMRWAVHHLEDLGITGGLVLVVGDEMGPLGRAPGSDGLLLVEGTERAVAVSVGVEPEGVPPRVLHLGGGPSRFLQLLRDQRDRDREGRVPSVDEDDAWVLRLPVDALQQRVHEALLTLSDGVVGTRGTLEELGEGRPSVLAAGVYDGGNSAEQLLAGPSWTAVGPHRPVTGGDDDLRLLDLRTGLLLRRSAAAAGMTSARFASITRPGVVAMRCESAEPIRAGPPLRPPEGVASVVHHDKARPPWVRVLSSVSGGITAAGSQRVRAPRSSLPWRLERICAYVADPRHAPPTRAASDRLRAARDEGFSPLLRAQREAWARRWSDATVSVVGDPESEQALRFALFHLLGSASAGREAAVGARGTSGPAYSGHVFWDADVFVLPALAAIAPTAARAVVDYRYHRLDAARLRARAEGREGARFPWESAREGLEAAPRWVETTTGRVAILTGELEEHVVADVAWAALHYARWCGDDGFLRGRATEILRETARYWASRCEAGTDGKRHVRGVIGPDEYHVRVDDNAFTNVMARWNLRQAAQLCGDVDDAERAGWLQVADALVDGYDPMTGRYEQFVGYDELEPIRVADVAAPPVAADMLLGAERVTGSRVIKQPDVLMLHLLVPDEVAPGSLAPNLEHYEPFTAHGSSLSPAVQAALLARAGRADEALRWFTIAGSMDLHDLTGTTAAGLHLATMGGLWQALAFGFLGLRVSRGALVVSPCLPQTWELVTLRMRVGGRRVVVRCAQDHASVEAEGPLQVVGSDGELVAADRCALLRADDGTWTARAS